MNIQAPKPKAEQWNKQWIISILSVFLADIAISHFSFAATDTREISF